MPRKIVSITPYRNEMHILKLRLGVLEDVVDHFYTIEASKTFSSLDKPMTAREFVHPKHTVVEIDFPEELDVWGRENYQRDCAVKFINLDAYNDDDIVLITDLDEIPNPKSLKILSELFDPQFNYSLNMNIYQYYLNNKNVGEGTWYKAKACSVGEFRSSGFNGTSLRMSNQSINIPDAGWHWTFIGDAEFIKKKIEDYAHTEFNTDHVKNNLQRSIESNTDALGRPFNLQLVSIDSDEFPEYVRANRESLKQYIKET